MSNLYDGHQQFPYRTSHEFIRIACALLNIIPTTKRLNAKLIIYKNVDAFISRKNSYQIIV